ncbi:MAG: 3-deoxy-manno-octulosonate cytidylyltransferase, partial [Gammaproteobacteria bacterium]|nr:3-deoxy-manno-octulosonate cytidylyltransferase [Gammaproteobacteria bacterium]
MSAESRAGGRAPAERPVGAAGKTYVVVPARYASERLPGKPLCDIQGRPLVVHVADRAREADVGPVWVATDDERVRAACMDHGIEVVMTRDSHRSGTERIAEVCAIKRLDAQAQVVNLQGDEPLMPASLIRQVAVTLDESGADMSTLSHRIESAEDLMSPNVVKVVTDSVGRALYFSRAPIPW